MPGVIAVGAGSGFSSVRMIPTIPPVADTDTPPVPSFASRFVATRWIDSPTFSNFTTGVDTVADVMAPVEDDVPGAAAPSRNPNTVAPKFATEKSGKFVFASIELATGSVMPGVTAVGAGSGFSSVRMIPTIPPVADTDTPPVASFASRFVATRWIDSPTFSNFTTGVATVADVIAPVADDVPGAAAPSRNPNTVAPKFATEKSGKSGFASVRMIPTIPPVADTDTPPVPSFASRFVATRWIDSPTFSNFTTGVATVADVIAPVEDDVPGAAAPSRNPFFVTATSTTEKSGKFVFASIELATGTVTLLA